MEGGGFCTLGLVTYFGQKGQSGFWIFGKLQLFGRLGQWVNLSCYYNLQSWMLGRGLILPLVQVAHGHRDQPGLLALVLLRCSLISSHLLRAAGVPSWVCQHCCVSCPCGRAPWNQSRWGCAAFACRWRPGAPWCGCEPATGGRCGSTRGNAECSISSVSRSRGWPPARHWWHCSWLETAPAFSPCRWSPSCVFLELLTRLPRCCCCRPTRRCPRWRAHYCKTCSRWGWGKKVDSFSGPLKRPSWPRWPQSARSCWSKTVSKSISNRQINPCYVDEGGHFQFWYYFEGNT